MLGSGISSVIQLGFPLPRLMERADIDSVTNATTPFPLVSRASVPDRAKISGVAPTTLVTEIVSMPVVDEVTQKLFAARKTAREERMKENRVAGCGTCVGEASSGALLLQRPRSRMS